MSEINSRVSDILKRKGNVVHTIETGTTVYDAISKMADNSVGCLVVMAGDQIAGIVTERDYLRKVALLGRSSKTTPVTEIMTHGIIYVSPDDTVEQCMAIMTEKRIRHLPVIVNEHLYGLVSIGDLIKQLSRDQRATIKYLTEYIVGKYPA